MSSSRVRKPPRRKIPPQIVDELLVKCKHKCCMCGAEQVEIAHIDDDRTNFDPDNLVPVCRNCHGKIHTRSDLTRNYSESQIKMYREEWIKKCAEVDFAILTENAVPPTIEQRLFDVERRLKAFESQ